MSKKQSTQVSNIWNAFWSIPQLLPVYFTTSKMLLISDEA